MKRILIFVFLLVSLSAKAQNLNSFFRDKGVKLLAEYAHPSNDFLNGNYSIQNNGVMVNINYKDGYKTKLFIYKSGNLFYDIRILSDNDFIKPFNGIQVLKDFIIELGGSNNPDISWIEEQIGQTIRNMSGKILACVIMTYEWLKY